MIERIEIRKFTVFDELETDLVPGVNIFIGANGTGKTHLLKLLYALLHPRWDGSSHEHKLLGVFKPSGSHERLIAKGEKAASIRFQAEGGTFQIVLPKDPASPIASGNLSPDDIKPLYIPVKEMLANAPGFRSLYAQRETHFEEVYADIIDKAFLPPLKTIDPRLEKSLDALQKAIRGKIITKNEVFYLKTGRGEIEFTLVAEGMRKLALLWLLIRNGALEEKTILFWDEPETNINPSMIPLVVEVLYDLERIGAQIFIATHSYVVCKEFELQRKEHSLRYYSLFAEEKRGIGLESSEAYHLLSPNRIADQYGRMYDLEIERALGKEDG